jgi:glycosyltransferase involved in cell wall biosynthesis
MRVWIVTVVHDPQDARIAVRELGTLLEDGHEVTFVAPFSAYGRPVPDGVAGLDVPRSAGRHRLRAVRAARATLREAAAQADLILLHDPELLLSVMGQRRRLRGARIMWDVHEDVPTLVDSRAWLPRWAAAPIRWGLRRLLLWAERHLELIVAEESYLKNFRDPHPVVTNAVTIPAQVPPPSGNRVVYVGRVTAQRGGEELLALGALLAGTAELLVMGPADAGLAERLTSATERGELDWRGFVPNREALPLIEGAIAGLSLLHDVPNYRHSLPTKLAEYGAHGVPIITTPNPSSVDFVEHSGAGVVVPFANVEAVAEVISRLIEHPEEAATLAAAGRETASTLFNWAIASETFRSAVAGR